MQEKDGVWLGPLGPAVKAAMIVSGAAAAAMALWLIAGQVWRAEPVGMFEMLRPEGRPEVPLMLGSLAAAMLFAALHLSDRKGAIERPPTGPMDIVALVMSRLAMIGIICVVVVMIYEVVARYVFEKPTLWANELSLWIAGFIFLLAGLYAMQQRSHIRIYVIYDLLPRPLQKAADVVSVGLIWGFFLCLLWGGYGEAVTKFARMETFGTAWDPPLPATIKPAILIVIGLVALQALSNLIADWNRPPEYHSALDDIDETEIANIRRTLED
ncbi:TRAP transporter small permease subunit [Rhodovulum kholense]|uniref:TRAP transporter small permease protein n=1 Tax=Rhodovulum kholense TaxID=453584 RepID=A0A8E2VQC4_9RHOB|nr:TRAP transporter small permease [Rhodovulum kholense]PTW51989.1 TRAP-type mannitol/chloroaromatic compound transport system permease small subunit [Rhodovulum kholense]